MNSAPTPFVKRQADRVDKGILSAEIDIEAVLDIAESAPEHDVLEILRVRDEHFSNALAGHPRMERSATTRSDSLPAGAPSA